MTDKVEIDILNDDYFECFVPRVLPYTALVPNDDTKLEAIQWCQDNIGPDAITDITKSGALPESNLSLFSDDLDWTYWAHDHKTVQFRFRDAKSAAMFLLKFRR